MGTVSVWPAATRTWPRNGRARGVAVAGEYVYMADGVGFLVLQVSGAVVVHETGALPSDFRILGNHPNPFNPATVIRFELPRSGQVRLNVYNVLGQKIATLAERVLSGGSHEIAWDGRSNSGVSVSAGVYFYTLTVGDRLETRKMLLLR